MANESVTEAPTSTSYSDLVNKCDELANFLSTTASILFQLGAQFATLRNGEPRGEELAALGLYVADEWANEVNVQAEEAMSFMRHAKAVLA